MNPLQRITPFLWFDGQAEQAAQFYTSVFRNSRILRTTRYTEAGRETHKKQPGSIMTVEFELDGQKFTAINGGPEFKFNESVSFVVSCDSQKDIDFYWEKLTAGGDPKAQICGWLKDKYGLSWQVVPAELTDLLSGGEERAGRVMTALMKMKKLDVDQLRRAAEVGVGSGVR